MGLLKRWQEGSGCGKLGRSGSGSSRHLESCPGCRARQQQERQYLQRLRGAAIPEASGDLTARLLARTEQLAAELPAAPSALPAPPHGPFRRQGMRLPVLLTGGAAAALALTAGAVYLLGAPAAPSAEDAGAATFLRQYAAGSAAAWDPERDAASAGPGWPLTGAPDFAPAGALSADQLAALRSQGWACPELRELGFHLIWAKGGVVDGGSVLELRLTDGRHFVTVLEQHRPLLPADGTAREHGHPAPVNVLTGHSAAADGFTAAGPSGMTGGPGSGSGTLWINAAAPFRAIYQTSGATFTYVADLPVEQAADAVTALMRAGAGTPAGPPDPAGVPERMERGLGRILQILAP